MGTVRSGLRRLRYPEGHRIRQKYRTSVIARKERVACFDGSCWSKRCVGDLGSTIVFQTTSQWVHQRQKQDAKYAYRVEKAAGVATFCHLIRAKQFQLLLARSKFTMINIANKIRHNLGLWNPTKLYLININNKKSFRVGFAFCSYLISPLLGCYRY